MTPQDICACLASWGNQIPPDGAIKTMIRNAQNAKDTRLDRAESALVEVMTFPRTPFPSEIAKRYFREVNQ